MNYTFVSFFVLLFVIFVNVLFSSYLFTFSRYAILLAPQLDSLKEKLHRHARGAVHKGHAELPFDVAIPALVVEKHHILEINVGMQMQFLEMSYF